MMTDPAASRPGTHLDPDRMADLLEGLLDDAAADEARAHLASCPVCSADFALISGEADPGGLGEPGELGGLGDLLPPVTIPQDVMTRIEAALYREPPLGTGTAAADEGAGHAAAAARPRRRRFGITLGALAGATLVIAGGFGIVTALKNGSSESKSSSGTAAGSAPSSQSADGSRLAGTAPDAQQMSPQVGGVPPHAGATPGSNELTVEQQAKALLGQHPMNPAGTTAGGQCAPAGTTAIGKPLAASQTQYQGKTVWLLIYPVSGDPAVADVFVVDANGCTPDNPGRVLDQFEIPRG